MRAVVWWLAVLGVAVDLAALSAHVLELPNKLGLPGPLWLAVQQRLYRGWGPALAPFEVGGTVAAWALAALARGRPGAGAASAAAVCLTVSLAVFFAVVQPVNVAFAGWTSATLPPDWSSYRWCWELGHAVRAALALAALACLLVARGRGASPRHPAGRGSSARPVAA